MIGEHLLQLQFISVFLVLSPPLAPLEQPVRHVARHVLRLPRVEEPVAPEHDEHPLLRPADRAVDVVGRPEFPQVHRDHVRVGYHPHGRPLPIPDRPAHRQPDVLPPVRAGGLVNDHPRKLGMERGHVHRTPALLDAGFLERQMGFVPRVLVVDFDFPLEVQPLRFGSVRVGPAVALLREVRLVEIRELLVVIVRWLVGANERGAVPGVRHVQLVPYPDHRGRRAPAVAYRHRLVDLPEHADDQISIDRFFLIVVVIIRDHVFRNSRGDFLREELGHEVAVVTVSVEYPDEEIVPRIVDRLEDVALRSRIYAVYVRGHEYRPILIHGRWR